MDANCIEGRALLVTYWFNADTLDKNLHKMLRKIKLLFVVMDIEGTGEE